MRGSQDYTNAPNLKNMSRLHFKTIGVQEFIKVVEPNYSEHLTEAWTIYQKDKGANQPLYFAFYECVVNVEHLRITNTDGSKDIPWAHRQEIKDLILGRHTMAVEVYPVSEDLKDGSHTYHLFAWPEMDKQVPNLSTYYDPVGGCKK